MRQVIERRNDRPTVHLRLVDLLRAVVQAGRIAQTDCIGRREQTKCGVRADDAALVEQRQAAGGFQDPLDDEHDVGASGIVFVEDKRDIVLVRPRQNAVAKLCDLLAVTQNDRILADQIDPADMAVEIDPHARPVQPRRNLFDMG